MSANQVHPTEYRIIAWIEETEQYHPNFEFPFNVEHDPRSPPPPRISGRKVLSRARYLGPPTIPPPNGALPQTPEEEHKRPLLTQTMRPLPPLPIRAIRAQTRAAQRASPMSTMRRPMHLRIPPAPMIPPPSPLDVQSLHWPKTSCMPSWPSACLSPTSRSRAPRQRQRSRTVVTPRSPRTNAFLPRKAYYVSRH
ncbi:hypothetical protein FISHEDRAFT_77787 [Fistulina hepatica ATCC 64428]|nr:hypothetical protein FISHEDRAFT_77787 [Fistulina hepatica ATCC 64428]